MGYQFLKQILFYQDKGEKKKNFCPMNMCFVEEFSVFMCILVE